MISYLSSHWRGEQTLGHSYWINGVLLAIPLNLYGNILEQLDVTSVGVPIFTLLFAIYFLIFAPFLVWMSVGILRSASAHIVKTSRKFWARFAQIIAAFNLILFPFIVYFYGAMFWSFAQIITEIDDLVAATVTLNESGILVLDGNIVFETPELLKNALSEHSDVSVVQLESLGGYLEPAGKIAELVREKGLETYTEYECTSACTHIFIAGSVRYIDFDAALGFHRSDLEGVPGDVIVAIMSEEDQIFLDQGVPATFVERVNSVPPEEVWYPTLQELLDANIITHVYDYNADVTYAADVYCDQNDCSIATEFLEEADDVEGS